MSLSRKDLESIICIACGKRYGEHTKGNGTKFNLPSLMTCMFRIQGTVVADGINNEPVSPLNNETVEDLENDFSQNPERQVGRFLTDGINNEEPKA